VFVHEKVHDAFVEMTAQIAKQRKVGDPMNFETEQGPQIDGDQFKKITHLVSEGQKEGAKLVVGGKRIGNKGWFFEPTVFTGVQDDMSIAKEEIFGPVMSVLKFKTVDEAIYRANNTAYGLASGVVTNSVDNALKISNAIRAGTVWVNTYAYLDATTPFGGFKDSGVGREGGSLNLDNYLETKTVIIKRPEDSLP
jgi:aldehyde dehydrogenase (NAD+)